MALERRLELRLAQKLVLTPQLQLAIKLLQIPQLELAQTLNQELIENPFLEEMHEESFGEDYAAPESEAPAAEDDAELPFENLVNFSVDEYFDERSSDGRDLGYFTSGVEDQPSYDMFYSKKPGLADHLLWQLRLSSADDEVRKVAGSVIGNIDEGGYLRATEEEIAPSVGAGSDLVKAAIELVQSFDPPGVAARDITECLLLQLKALGLGGTLVEKIVVHNMEDLQKKRYQAIAKQYHAPLDDIMAAVKIIEGLEPRPGVSLSSDETSYVVPDVYIVKSEEGYKIVLNEDGLPRLRLNHGYRKLLLTKESLTRDERRFLRDKLRLASELMKSLDQRNRTIYRVSESILKFQRAFFDHGIQSLRPLNLKDVASDINMHESTISRVTSNKFLSCHHGIFSFRFFFSSAVKSEDGEVSSTSVKEVIKKVIAEEDPKKPLSDQMIAEELKRRNVNIARRTVAKYREELKIPSQSQRKRYE
jgi:RNA polymerase sigma-54 factor